MATSKPNKGKKNERVHPETKKGEVFLGNIDPKNFASIGYASKRMGDKMKGSQFFRPVFVSKKEYLDNQKRENK